MGNKIMLNGAEMGKIVLNGVEYGGGSGGGELVADNKVVNANGNFSYDVAELDAGYYLFTATSNTEQRTGGTETYHGNLFRYAFYFDGTNYVFISDVHFLVPNLAEAAFQINFLKDHYEILLTTWGPGNECKFSLAKVDPLVVEMYT